MRLRAVDPDGNFSTSGAELLEQSPICADPQIFLCYFHLESKTDMFSEGKFMVKMTSSNGLTAQRNPDPGVVSSPSNSLVISIM